MIGLVPAFTPSPAFRTVWAVYLVFVLVVVAPVVLVICARFLMAVFSIRGYAARTRKAALSARGSTQHVGELAETLRLAGEILEAAKTIEGHATGLATTLSKPTGARRE